MANQPSTPSVYRVSGRWLTHGAWQKSKQNKERARKRRNQFGLMVKLPSLKQQLRGEERSWGRVFDSVRWMDS